MIGQAARPDLGAYRRFIVAFSGGKDSLAALLHLLSLGVPAHAVELHHHDVDGHGPTFMDWPCTAGYAATDDDTVMIDRETVTGLGLVKAILDYLDTADSVPPHFQIVPGRAAS